MLALFEGVAPATLLSATLLHSALGHLLPTLLGAVTTATFLRDIVQPAGEEG